MVIMDDGNWLDITFLLLAKPPISNKQNQNILGKL